MLADILSILLPAALNWLYIPLAFGEARPSDYPERHVPVQAGSPQAGTF